MVLIDTLNRAAAGADENGPADMGRILAGAAALQERIGGLVLLVHHSGKDQGRGPRGHSSLLASADAAIEVERQAAQRLWRLYKAKDASDEVKHGFELVTVELGTVEGAAPITSCVVREVDLDAALEQASLPKGLNQRTVLASLTALFADIEAQGGPADIEVGKAIERIKGDLQVEKGRQHERTVAAIKSLVRQGFVRQEGDRLSLSAPSADPTETDGASGEPFDPADDVD